MECSVSVPGSTVVVLYASMGCAPGGGHDVAAGKRRTLSATSSSNVTSTNSKATRAISTDDSFSKLIVTNPTDTVSGPDWMQSLPVKVNVVAAGSVVVVTAAVVVVTVVTEDAIVSGVSPLPPHAADIRTATDNAAKERIASPWLGCQATPAESATTMS
jgi:hypothetical protein